jgi:ElaB/YqjD/DUF883 family membrane-anchored ribosome-binding protein
LDLRSAQGNDAAKEMKMTKARTDEAAAEASEGPDPAAQIAVLQAELARLQTAIAELGQAGASRLHERLTEGAGVLRAQAGDEMAEAVRQLELAYGSTTDLARRNPAAALAVAAGAGLILGLLLGRR